MLAHSRTAPAKQIASRRPAARPRCSPRCVRPLDAERWGGRLRGIYGLVGYKQAGVRTPAPPCLRPPCPPCHHLLCLLRWQGHVRHRAGQSSLPALALSRAVWQTPSCHHLLCLLWPRSIVHRVGRAQQWRGWCCSPALHLPYPPPRAPPPFLFLSSTRGWCYFPLLPSSHFWLFSSAATA